MSDGEVIRLHCGHCTEAPVSAEGGDVTGEVLPLRAADDRRGTYVELRALIDLGLELEVSFETTS